MNYQYRKATLTLQADQVAIHCFEPEVPNGKTVLLLHGSIENARIFFSRSGKGLAPFLANAGYTVFAADLRGKGGSVPAVSKGNRAGQYDTIETEIPALIRWAMQETGRSKLILGAHSWGGVLALATLARKPELLPHISALLCFGSKRRIGVFSLRRLWIIDILWSGIGTFCALFLGYLPARRLKMGSDDEPGPFFLQVNRWVYARRWKFYPDGSDIARTLRSMQLPPSLFLTGVNDKLLGHASDVKRLLKESGIPEENFRLLSRKNGNLEDYDHINILTHPSAYKDHFIFAEEFLKSTT